MKFRLILIIMIAASVGLFLFLVAKKPNSISVSTNDPAVDESASSPLIAGFFGNDKAPEPEIPAEIPKNLKLENPPERINALYATSWSASSSTKIAYFIDLVKTTKANALVIDIKDYSGLLAYETSDSAVMKYASVEKKISDPVGLVAKLHENGIYTIARVVVFQDPALAVKRPDLAVKNSKTGATWADNKKLAWMDPGSREVWEYNAAVARDAFAKGFDEVNFDYIRFPSDGDLTVMSYPFYDAAAMSKSNSIKDFFVYLRDALKGEKISADLFGLTVLASDDLGIGQIMGDAFANFDYICPMVYPSHFAAGFIGYKNPAEYPYEVIKHSMEEANAKLEVWAVANPGVAHGKVRPWLQDFDLGADYGTAEVKAQINAVGETANSGWMLWSPKNLYTKEAIINN